MNVIAIISIGIIILAVLSLCLAFIFLMGKGDKLIAGYNTASEKEREKVNIRRLRVIMAILSLITSGYLILKLPGCDILPRFADTVIYLIIIFTVVIFANTWCIKK